MAPQVAGFEFVWSAVRRKEVQKSLIYSDGFVYLEGDPRPWIQRNLPLRLSVRSLELCDYVGEKIGDSIVELAGLTHPSIRDSTSLKCVANVLRLNNLQLLRIIHCENLEDLPPNLGELRNLTHLELSRCKAIKSLPSFASLRSLQRLYLGLSVKELPINLDELPQLLLLDIKWCGNIKYLPCNIKNLINLQFFLLPWNFRLETLPFDLNDSVIISVESRHIRKTWEELKLEMGPLFIGAPPSMVEMVMEAAQNRSPIFASGYLSLKEDPSTWIQIHYNLRFLLRILDLELPDTVGEIGDFIGKLPNLTHLYMSATHYFQGLGKLSSLKSLDLCLRKTKLAAVLDLPFCLEHLTLRYCDYYSLPDSVAKLSNLNTLELYRCNQVAMPENLNLTKLKLVCYSVEPLPPSICFLEIVHDTEEFTPPVLKNESIVKIDFDGMDAIYYKDNGYCCSFYESSSETSDEDNEITPVSVAGVDDAIWRESGDEDIITIYVHLIYIFILHCRSTT